MIAERAVDCGAVAEIRFDECRPAPGDRLDPVERPPPSCCTDCRSRTGVHPAAISSTQVCEPMNPVPPVRSTEGMRQEFQHVKASIVRTAAVDAGTRHARAASTSAQAACLAVAQGSSERETGEQQEIERERHARNVEQAVEGARRQGNPTSDGGDERRHRMTARTPAVKAPERAADQEHEEREPDRSLIEEHVERQALDVPRQMDLFAHR